MCRIANGNIGQPNQKRCVCVSEYCVGISGFFVYLLLLSTENMFRLLMLLVFLLLFHMPQTNLCQFFFVLTKSGMFCVTLTIVRRLNDYPNILILFGSSLSMLGSVSLNSIIEIECARISRNHL